MSGLLATSLTTMTAMVYPGERGPAALVMCGFAEQGDTSHTL